MENFRMKEHEEREDPKTDGWMEQDGARQTKDWQKRILETET
jgi:hypothetical protein